MSEEFLERACDVAFARLEEVGQDPRHLDEPLRTVAIVCSAQAVIDNGGLCHLFENDWPAQPPYSVFSDAYRTIGAEAEAAAIDAAAAMLTFSDPERHRRQREELLAGEAGKRIEALGAALVADVWMLLAEYAHTNRDAFDGADHSRPHLALMSGRHMIPNTADWDSEPLCLDGRRAHENFGGKDLSEAFELFVDNASLYQEDLMFMPARCFLYYVRAYIDYLLCDKSEGDSDGASCFFSLVEHRSESLSGADKSLRRGAEQLLVKLAENQRWYDADVGIYGSFPERARRCLQLIRS